MVGWGGEMLVSASAASAAGDDEFFAEDGEVVDDLAGGLIDDDGADGDGDFDGIAIAAGFVATFAVSAAFGLMLRVKTEVKEGVVVGAGDKDDVAATAAITAGGAAFGHEFLAAEGHTAVAAVAGLYIDSNFVNKHGYKHT